MDDTQDTMNKILVAISATRDAEEARNAAWNAVAPFGRYCGGCERCDEDAAAIAAAMRLAGYE